MPCDVSVPASVPFFGGGGEQPAERNQTGCFSARVWSAVNTAQTHWPEHGRRCESVDRTMLRRAAVLKRADDENVDSGADTAE